MASVTERRLTHEHDRRRAERFCARFGLWAPILLAPMAGATPPSLSIAVMRAGGLGACGALRMRPADEVRAAAPGPFQLNLWVPDPPPVRDTAREGRPRVSREPGPSGSARSQGRDPAGFRDPVCGGAGRAPADRVVDHGPVSPAVRGDAQGARDPLVRDHLHRHGGTGRAAGADVTVARGMEAGGRRGSFDSAAAERGQVGLLALPPAVADAVGVPVVGTGGIADERGVAAALTLGASAVQIGTGFLRCPEAQIHPAWADAITRAAPEETVLSRVFSGRASDSIPTDYVRAATASDKPPTAPNPVQAGLTAPMMRAAAEREGDARMTFLAGQSAALARAEPAGNIVRALRGAQKPC